MADNAATNMETQATHERPESPEDLVAASSKSESSNSLPAPDDSEATIQQNLSQLCLSIGDATLTDIPMHLRNMLAKFDDIERKSQAELLFIVIYTCAMESGFISLTEAMQIIESIVPIQTSCYFHADNLKLISNYKPTYQLDSDRNIISIILYSLVNINFEQTQSTRELDILKSQLSCVLTGDLMIITFSSATNGLSLCLSIARYVLGTRTSFENIGHRFRHLDELEYLLREKLFVPMRNSQLIELGAQIYPALTGLPVEIYDEIMQHLSPNQLNILANVNRQLNICCRESRFMKKTK